MIRHENEVNVHKIGCDIFSLLAREDNRTCEAIRVSAVITSILNGMKSHVNDSDAQLKAFETLKLLSTMDGQQPYNSVIFRDVISSIEDAIQKHKGNVAVQREGSQAIAQISSAF